MKLRKLLKDKNFENATAQEVQIAVLKALIEAFEEIHEAKTDDGRIDVGEAIGLTDNVISIGRILLGVDKLKVAFADFDTAALEAIMANDFDIENEDLKGHIQRGFKMIMAIIEFAEGFKK